MGLEPEYNTEYNLCILKTILLKEQKRFCVSNQMKPSDYPYVLVSVEHI